MSSPPISREPFSQAGLDFFFWGGGGEERVQEACNSDLSLKKRALARADLAGALGDPRCSKFQEAQGGVRVTHA